LYVPFKPRKLSIKVCVKFGKATKSDNEICITLRKKMSAK